MNKIAGAILILARSHLRSRGDDFSLPASAYPRVRSAARRRDDGVCGRRGGRGPKRAGRRVFVQTRQNCRLFVGEVASVAATPPRRRSVATAHAGSSPLRLCADAQERTGDSPGDDVSDMAQQRGGRGRTSVGTHDDQVGGHLVGHFDDLPRHVVSQLEANRVRDGLQWARGANSFQCSSARAFIRWPASS